MAFGTNQNTNFIPNQTNTNAKFPHQYQQGPMQQNVTPNPTFDTNTIMPN